MHLSEVELGTGRPDGLLVVASKSGLLRRAEYGLRLPTLAHARVLEATAAGRRSGYSISHERRLHRTLSEIGWITDSGRLRFLPRLVSRSLLIEAKIADWRTGLCQLRRARWAANSAALLMPATTHHRVPRKMLDRNRIGMMVLGQRGIETTTAPASTPTTLSAELWVSELAIRSLL